MIAFNITILIIFCYKISNNPVCILNIHVMYFNFKIRLIELEGVSSKQTYLGVVEQLITDNDNYQQVACENCGGKESYCYDDVCFVY